MKDPYNLERSVDAQNPIFEDVCSELRAGRKSSHWMWFVFPQIQGLGLTSTSREFAISSLAEAEAYMEHPVLGSRLRRCSALVASIDGASIEQIFGKPDCLKFRSSMSLFAHATPDNQVFVDALKKYFRGEFDPRTIQFLSKA